MDEPLFQPNNIKLRTVLKQFHSLLDEILLFSQKEGRFAEIHKLLATSIPNYHKTLQLVLEAQKQLDEIQKESDSELLFRATQIFQNYLIQIFSDFRDAFMSMAENIKGAISEKHFAQNSPEGYMARNHHLMFKAYKELRHELNARLIIEYKKANELVVDEDSLLFDITGMKQYTYVSDIDKMRDYAIEVLEYLPQCYTNLAFLLEYNVSELIKNAIRHGNNCDVSKTIEVHSEITHQYFRIVVSQQGKGFTNLEDWNEYYQKRLVAFENCDIDRMIELACYASENSNEQDGGNALIAALDFWDSGLVYNNERNSVSALKILPPLVSSDMDAETKI